MVKTGRTKFNNVVPLLSAQSPRSTYKLTRRLFQIKSSSSSRLTAILSLILSSQPNILIILKAPIATISSSPLGGHTFSNTIDSDIGSDHFLLLELGILFGQQTGKREGTDGGDHSDNRTPTEDVVEQDCAECELNRREDQNQWPISTLCRSA